MNKVFKIIYNFSIQQFVVVSELSKSKGKSSGKIDKRIKPEALLSLSVAGGLFLGSNVFAANLVTPNQFYAETDNTNSFVAIGETAKKQSEGGGVVIGTNASVNRKNAVAIGQNVSVGMQSTDGGWQLLGSETTAIGSNVTAGMNNSVVMGSNILVGVPDFPSGTTIGHIVESVAIGSKLNTPTGHVTMMGSNITAPGQYSIGIGNDIFIKETSVTGARTNSVLMGFGLNSTAAKTFSVGSNIQASGSDMVSMGADIVNNAPTRGIAIGDKVNITTTSSYVVAIGSATKAFGGGAIAVGREAIARDTSKNLIVMGTSATAGGGEGAMALGFSANATSKGAVAIGRKSLANGESTISIGSESSVTGLNSVALGSGISVDTAGSVVLGNASSSTVAETVSDANVGSYTYSADRFAGKDFSNRAGSYVSVGSATNPRQIKFVGAGKIDKTSTDAINGSQLYAVMERAETGWNITTSKSGNGDVSGTIDDNIGLAEILTVDASNNINITQSANKISIATSTKPTFETVNVTNRLNVGDIVVDASGINMANKPITNLKAGVADTDAVNVSQLKQASSAVRAGTNTYVGTAANETSGGTDYIVHAFNTTASAGSQQVTVEGTFDPATNTTNYVIDLAQTTKDSLTKANEVAVAANNTANAGWKLNTTSSGNGKVTGSSDETINMNETVTLDAGNNINITQAQNKITIATSTKPTFETVNVTNSLNVGDIVMNASGLNMANKPITNLQAGVADTDAVNVSQLKQASSAVRAGTNTYVGTAANATSGGTDYIVHTFNTTATGSDQIKVTPTFDSTTNTTNYAIDLSDSAKSNITTANDIANAANNTANAGWKLNTTSSGNGQVSGSSDETINMNETVTLDAGNNINITQAQNKITIATSTKPTFETVNVTNSLNVGDIVVDANGINMANKPITNLKAGEADTDAVNVSQLKNASSNMIATGLNFAGDNNVTVHRDLGQTLKIEGGATSNLTYGNIGVVEDPANGSLSVRLAEKLNLGSNGTITMGNTTLADNQIKVGEQTRIGNGTATIGDITIADGKLTGLKDGKISADSTEAINGSQLYNVVNNISNVAGDVAKGWNLNTSASGGFVENSSLEQIKMGETVTIDAGKNVNITQAGNTVSIAVSNNPTFENVTTDNLIFAGNPNATLSYAGDGFNLNGNKLTNVANGTNATDAVNVQQLNNAGWTVAGNGSSVSKVVNNNVVSFDNGSGTTARVAKNNDGSTSVSYDVNRSPIITNSEGKLVAGNKSGFATADDIANAINQSGWKVQSTATAGTTGKVVNLDSNGNQMARQSATKVSVGNTVNINAGNNVVVTRQGRNIEVATSMTPTFNTVSVGNGEVTIGASKDTDGVSQVTLAGKDGKSAVRVTNIATGKADTDAVNVGQLRNTARALTNNINAVNDRVTKVDRRLRAGVAGALAVGNLPQVHTNGKSQLAAGVGSYRGQNALAVGYSRLSDNGKVILKVSGNADTRGDVGGAASIGFEW